MEKKDLKFGNVVKFRNGKLALIHPKANYDVIKRGVLDTKIITEDKIYFRNIKNGTWESTLCDYDEVLKSDDENVLCDIMEIYEDYTLNNLLWKRKELPKLTPDERTILENIPMKWKYIARDENGNLWLYKVKPYKNESGSWTSGKIDGGMIFKLFNQIFEFIEWKDEEPYCIKDLLEG